MKIGALLSVAVFVLVGTQVSGAKTLYCNNNAHRDTISADRVCDPGGTASQQCLSYTSRQLAAKESCFAQIKACQARVNQQNERIRQGNELYYKCKAAFDKKQEKKSDSKSRWKSKLKQAQTRNANRSQVEKSNKRVVDKTVRESWSRAQTIQEEAARETAEIRRQTEQLRQRQAQEAAKIRRRKSVIGTNPNNSCGVNPLESGLCGTPDNPCQSADIDRWHRCMGTPGF